MFSISESVCLFFAKNQAIKIETMYRTIIGAANNIIFGMSAVGDATAATIIITIRAIFQLFINSAAEINPILDKT